MIPQRSDSTIAKELKQEGTYTNITDDFIKELEELEEFDDDLDTDTNTNENGEEEEEPEEESSSDEDGKESGSKVS